MGLDLEPFGRPKPGHEAEWEKLMRTPYGGKEEKEKDADRRIEISIPSFADLGAPRVGYDTAADDWILKNWRRKEGVSDAELLKELRGHHVIELLQGTCDGLPRYSNGSVGYDVDETSFRGEFLRRCSDILDEGLLNRAWTLFMRPEEAVAYGEELLAVARKAAATKLKPSRGPWGARKPERDSESGDALTYEEQLDVLQSAGRWYVFWGKRGHPIHAYF